MTIKMHHIRIREMMLKQYVVLNLCIRKCQRSQTSELSFQFMKLEKEQVKLKIENRK